MMDPGKRTGEKSVEILVPAIKPEVLDEESESYCCFCHLGFVF
jgi:hypothetical protein